MKYDQVSKLVKETHGNSLQPHYMFQLNFGFKEMGQKGNDLEDDEKIDKI